MSVEDPLVQALHAALPVWPESMTRAQLTAATDAVIEDLAAAVRDVAGEEAAAAFRARVEDLRAVRRVLHERRN